MRIRFFQHCPKRWSIQISDRARFVGFIRKSRAFVPLKTFVIFGLCRSPIVMIDLAVSVILFLTR